MPRQNPSGRVQSPPKTKVRNQTILPCSLSRVLVPTESWRRISSMHSRSSLALSSVCPTLTSFFFLECGRCRAEARSLHESKLGMQRQGQKVLGNGKSIEATTTKTTTKPKATTRKFPARLAFRQRRQRSKQQTTHNHKTGPEPKQKHPPNRFALGRSG